MKKFAALLLAAATALTPLAAAQAQREGHETIRDEDAEASDRAPRGPEIRQMDRRDWQRGGGSETRNRDDRPGGDWRRYGRGDGSRQVAPVAPAPRRDGPAAWTHPGSPHDRNHDERVDRRWDRHRDGNFDRHWDQHRDGRVDPYGHDRRGYDGRSWDQRSWNRSWRDDRRFDWYGHRNRYRDHYRLGRYYSPVYGHRYSRFSIGFGIGTPFYRSSYWINDPWRYRLPDVYGPYRWVRYYNDVLLVDIYRGRVVDVIYDFFW